jgi:uncharacterized protein (DUF1015 family)
LETPFPWICWIKQLFFCTQAYHSIDEYVKASAANLNPPVHTQAESHLTNTIFTVNENYKIKLTGSD